MTQVLFRDVISDDMLTTNFNLTKVYVVLNMHYEREYDEPYPEDTASFSVIQHVLTT